MVKPTTATPPSVRRQSGTGNRTKSIIINALKGRKRAQCNLRAEFELLFWRNTIVRMHSFKPPSKGNKKNDTIAHQHKIVTKKLYSFKHQ